MNFDDAVIVRYEPNDEIKYDEQKMQELLAECATYEEFRIKCDVNGIECIISRDEFNTFRELYADTFELKFGMI